MMELSFVQVNQTSVFVLLVALAGLIRERKILPFVWVIIGSFLFGDVPAAAIAATALLVRLQSEAPLWLRLKDSISLMALAAAFALPEPYREFMICMGVVLVSIHFCRGPLGIVPSLLLTHAYFGDQIALEFVLGGAGFYILVAEALRLAKSPHERKVLQWIEIPAVLVVLFPFQDWVMRWAQEESLLVMSVAIAVMIVALLIWNQVKAPDFSKIYERISGRVNLAISKISGLNSEGRIWVRNEADLDQEVVEKAFSFDRLFYGILAVSLAWIALTLFHLGGAP